MVATFVWPFLSALAALVAVGAVAMERWFVARAPSPVARALLPRLRRELDAQTRLALCVRECPAESWEGRLARSVSSAHGELDRVDAASEAAWGLASELEARGRWGLVGIRIGAAGGVLLAVIATAVRASVPVYWAFGPALVGVVVAIALHAPARTAERAQRELADELLRLLVPEARAPRPLRRRSQR